MTLSYETPKIKNKKKYKTLILGCLALFATMVSF